MKWYHLVELTFFNCSEAFNLHSTSKQSKTVDVLQIAGKLNRSCLHYVMYFFWLPELKITLALTTAEVFEVF